MSTTILIILSNTLLIAVFYYQNQLIDYEQNLQTIKKQHLNKQISNLKNDVNNIINMIEYKYTKEELANENIKNEIIQWLASINFDKQKSDYVFVYELLQNIQNDKFAIMIINPNRSDLIGQTLSLNYTDKNGFHFRKKLLKDINEKGESTLTYVYKKTSSKIEKKITYAKYLKQLNWIIAKGIYKDDIQITLGKKSETLLKQVNTNINKNIFAFLIFLFIAIIVTYIISKKIQNIINEKNAFVNKATNELSMLNMQLDNKVKIQIEKTKEQEQILMKKAKFIALGETISLIAHQWRQPLNELGAILINIKLHHKLNKLDENIMKKKSQEVETLLSYMSKTIDDFRTFFKPNKVKNLFNINDSIQRVLHITQAMLEEYNIKIITNINKSIIINNYQNEFEQVVLNLITNAKDALRSDNISSPIITINIYIKNYITIEINDNANGINKNLIEKIWQPYFTTKSDANGTGIGLYMSKIIIEKNMKGRINVNSNENGSCFIITFKE